MIITIAGASGFIGTALERALGASGHIVRRLTRADAVAPGTFHWNPDTGTIDRAALEGAGAVINLAGANLAGGRWTEARKRLLRDSRVRSTELLAQGIASAAERPAVLVSASGIGYYGTRADIWVDEGSPAGEGFLAKLCRDWERAADSVASAGVRVVKLRLGVVLSPEGGALVKMLPVFRLGLGGPLGGGRAWMSWISLGDLVRLVEHAIGDVSLAGAVNAVSPNPVTNREFTAALGRALHRPAVLPVPAWVLRLALGEMADETILASARGNPRRLLESGFEFRHSTIDAALGEQLRPRA